MMSNEITCSSMRSPAIQWGNRSILYPQLYLVNSCKAVLKGEVECACTKGGVPEWEEERVLGRNETPEHVIRGPSVVDDLEESGEWGWGEMERVLSVLQFQKEVQVHSSALLVSSHTLPDNQLQYYLPIQPPSIAHDTPNPTRLFPASLSWEWG